MKDKKDNEEPKKKDKTKFDLLEEDYIALKERIKKLKKDEKTKESK